MSAATALTTGTPCDTSPDPAPDTPAVLRGATPDAAPAVAAAVLDLPVGDVERDPNQPRRHFDREALEQLAESLTRFGQLQPILVRPAGAPGRYTIVCGERRWRAARRAGLPTVRAVVVEGPREPAADFECQLVENLIRADLNPIDEAVAYQNLMQARGLSARSAAAALGVSVTTVCRALQLLELPPLLRAAVADGRIVPKTALRGLKSPGQGRGGADAPGRPAAPASRRVFETRDGRVTVELRTPATQNNLLNALEDVFQIIEGELDPAR